MILRAQFAGGHSGSDVDKIYFPIRLITKQTFMNLPLFCPILTNIKASKVFLTLFFDKNKTQLSKGRDNMHGVTERSKNNNYI